MGMGGGSSSGSTPNTAGAGQTVSANALPQNMQDSLNSLMSRAATQSQTPYTPYSGQRVAGLAPIQEQGINAIGAAGATANDWLGQAANKSAGIGQYNPQMTSAKQVTAGTFPQVNISDYMNPYTQNVVDTTNQEINRQNQITNQQSGSHAASQGAFGGSRDAIVQSENNRNALNTIARNTAGLNQQGYTQAQNTAETDLTRMLQAQGMNQSANLQGQLANQSTDLQAQRANQASGLQSQMANQSAGLQGAGLGLNAANSLANFANSSQNMNIQQGQADIASGNIQQQNQQQNLNVPYQNYLNAQQYPYQNLQFLSGIYSGIPYNNFTTQVNSTATPSGLAQGIGAGAAGLGALANNGVFNGLFGGSGSGSADQSSGILNSGSWAGGTDLTRYRFASGGLIEPGVNSADAGMIDKLYDPNQFTRQMVSQAPLMSLGPQQSQAQGGGGSSGGSGGGSSMGQTVGKTIGGIGGSVIGGPIGGMIGGAVGDFFGGLFAEGGRVPGYASGGISSMVDENGDPEVPAGGTYEASQPGGIEIDPNRDQVIMPWSAFNPVVSGAREGLSRLADPRFKAQAALKPGDIGSAIDSVAGGIGSASDAALHGINSEVGTLHKGTDNILNAIHQSQIGKWFADAVGGGDTPATPASLSNIAPQAPQQPTPPAQSMVDRLLAAKQAQVAQQAPQATPLQASTSGPSVAAPTTAPITGPTPRSLSDLANSAQVGVPGAAPKSAMAPTANRPTAPGIGALSTTQPMAPQNAAAPSTSPSIPPNVLQGLNVLAKSDPQKFAHTMAQDAAITAQTGQPSVGSQLMRFGLEMMATKSPSLMGAVGQAGLNTLSAQQQQQQIAKQHEMEGRKLDVEQLFRQQQLEAVQGRAGAAQTNAQAHMYDVTNNKSLTAQAQADKLAAQANHYGVQDQDIRNSWEDDSSRGVPQGTTMQVIAALKQDNPNLTTEQALNIYRSRSNSGLINQKMEGIAANLAKADPGGFKDPVGTLNKYRSVYGLSTAQSAPAQQTPPLASNGATQAPQAQMPPPAALSRLKESVVTTFNNGQKWTIRNGQPAQVQ